jgi:hypothetical protein
MIHLDSSFLIDLQRELARGRPGPALDFICRIDDRRPSVYRGIDRASIR